MYKQLQTFCFGVLGCLLLLAALSPAPAHAQQGVIVGGWGYVWAAYGISWTVILFYINHLRKRGGL